MDAKFVLIMESLTGKRFDSADAALELPTSKATQSKTKANVDTAFNILAVSEGLRNMAFIGGVPKSWVPHPDWGLISVRYNGTWVAREAAINRATLTRLTSMFRATRENLDVRVEREVGKQLGYIQPQPRFVDGFVYVHLNLPNDNGRIKSEFGPQSVRITKTLITSLHRMQTDLNALAQAVHPKFEVHVTLVLTSTHR